MRRYFYDITFDVAAAPERVLEVMSDVERWPEWTATVTSIRRLDQGPFAVGSRAIIRQPKLPPAMWTVTAMGPGHAFTWVSGMPGMRVIAHHAIEPQGSNASRVTLSVAYEGFMAPLLAWFTADQTRRYLRVEADGLTARSLDAGWSRR
jgi:hypothetical protein